MPECIQVGFWPHLVDGLTIGSIYALIALGYTLVYGVLQLINFAHSEVFMVGSFAALHTVTALGVTQAQTGPKLVLIVALAISVAMIASALTALALERIAYRPLRKRGAPRLAFLISAIGASLFLTYLFQVIKPLGGPSPRPYPEVIAHKEVFRLFNYGFSNKQVLVVFTVIGMYLLLDRFVMKARVGRAIRAVAQDPQTASLMGVNIDRVIVVVFLVGGLMAGVAGSLYGFFFGQARFNIGFIPGIKAFTAAVLGGIGNIRGALLGGLLLGLIENLGVTCIGSQWKDIIAFTVLVVILMFRPTGLLGEHVRV